MMLSLSISFLLLIQVVLCDKKFESSAKLRGNAAPRISDKENTRTADKSMEDTMVATVEMFPGKLAEKRELVFRRLMPEDFMELSLWTYMETVEAEEEDLDLYSRFLALMKAAGKTDALSTLTGITLLAPSDDAISRNMKDFLLAADNIHILQEVMNYHIVPRVVSFLSSEFKNTINGIASTTTFTVAGDNLNLSLDQNGFYINGVTNVLAYALTNESILYRIDRLLIPPSMNGVIPEELFLENSQPKENIQADIAYEFPVAIPDGFFMSNTITDSGTLSDMPSFVPSDVPSSHPSSAPSSLPSDTPSILPDFVIEVPSGIDSDSPSLSPSDIPSNTLSDVPSVIPSDVPTTVSINLS
jgi:uncharacterized surface protein with fasciclin (FAS1) repeats